MDRDLLGAGTRELDCPQCHVRADRLDDPPLGRWNGTRLVPPAWICPRCGRVVKDSRLDVLSVLDMR